MAIDASGPGDFRHIDRRVKAERSPFLISTEPGVALQTRKGALCVRERGGEEGLYRARVHRLKTIILAGHGASVTSEALRWCVRENVALFIMERAGECLTLLGVAGECDARRSSLGTRQKQFAAVLSLPRRLEIARKIVAAKLQTLALRPEDARAFRAEIANAKKIEDLLVAEARAGAAYFMRFRGFEVRFKDDKSSPSERLANGEEDRAQFLDSTANGRRDKARGQRGEIPAHWHVFAARAGETIKGKGGTSKARHAATPIGAMLNYAYVVAVGQVTRAAIGAGFDACHGFLHSPKPGRLSLSYDLLEFHRAELTEAIFRMTGNRVWMRKDFELNAAGIVRLSGATARDVAGLALKIVSGSEASKSARRVRGWL